MPVWRFPAEPAQKDSTALLFQCVRTPSSLHTVPFAFPLIKLLSLTADVVNVFLRIWPSGHTRAPLLSVSLPSPSPSLRFSSRVPFRCPRLQSLGAEHSVELLLRLSSPPTSPAHVCPSSPPSPLSYSLVLLARLHPPVRDACVPLSLARCVGPTPHCGCHFGLWTGRCASVAPWASLTPEGTVSR